LAGASSERVERPGERDEIDDAEEIGDDLEQHHQVRSEGEAPYQKPEESKNEYGTPAPAKWVMTDRESSRRTGIPAPRR
jgi:hypothetical protein